MTTRELLDYTKAREGETIEAEIRSGCLRATHWLHFWRGRYYHEGIDGERHRTSARSLLESYPRTIWTICPA